MRILKTLAMIAVLLGAAGHVWAGQNPKLHFALDCQPRSKRQCMPAYASCCDINWVCESSGYYDIIVVVYSYYVITAVEYGLDYSGVEDWYVTGFVSCTDFMLGGVDLGGWMSCAQVIPDCWYAENPPPGSSGIGIGWLRLYGGAGRIDIVPSDQNHIQALDCRLAGDPAVPHSGFVGGAQPGPDDPPPFWGPTVTEPVTWSRIKTFYR